MKHRIALAILIAVPFSISAQTADQPVEKLKQLPPGKHALLERFTAEFGLTMDQQLEIEPLLHAEESVSKPLLAFAAFTPEQKTETMTKIKLAARRQIRPLLTPEQQAKMDGEIETVRKANGKAGGTGKNAKKAPAQVDPYENEEALSTAIMHYAALLPGEKKAMMLEVKLAARSSNQLQLTPEQQKKIDSDIQLLSVK